jgi:hypothetical protein
VRTLLDEGNTEALNAEMQRFDVLRTLIHRAVRALLSYAGPYVDYGAREPGQSYPIRWTSARRP